jgi:hypothetical protein
MLKPNTLSKGHEQYERFTRRGKPYVQYDYRDLDGELFSCVRSTLEACKAAVIEMLNKKYPKSGGVK